MFIQTSDKIDGNKNLQHFFTVQHLLSHKGSPNSGLGLIADDHNTAGRSGPENLAGSRVNWQRFGEV